MTRDEALEILERVVFEQHAQTRSRNADVVVEDVERTELLDGRAEHGDDVVFLRHIRCDRDRRATGVLNEADRFLGPPGVEVGADDPSALFCETKCGGPPDAGPRSRDDGILSLKPHWIDSPSWVMSWMAPVGHASTAARTSSRLSVAGVRRTARASSSCSNVPGA